MANTSNSRVFVEVDIEGQMALKELSLLQTQANKLTAELKNMKKGTEEYANANQELKKVNEQLKQHQEQIGISGMTIAQLTHKKNQLYQEIRKNLIPGTEEYIKKTEELQKVDARLQELNKGIRGVTEATQKMEKGWVFSIDVLGILQGITGGVQSLGNELDEVVRKTSDLQGQISQLSGVNVGDIDKMTISVQALSEKFGKEYNEVLKASTSLAQGMGITQVQALNLIEKGFVKGADANGDFLDKIAEYPVQFKNAGFSAEQFVKIATQEVKGGIYSDKLVDSVKELGLRLRELAPAQQDALKNAFGEAFTADFVKRVKSGSLDASQAIGLIEEQMKKTNLSATQMQTLIADLGGGPVEDVGGLLTVFKELANANKLNLDELNNYEKAQKTQLEGQKRLSEANIALTKEFAPVISAMDKTAQSIKIGLIEGFVQMVQTGKGVINFLNENKLAVIPLILAYGAYNAQMLINKATILGLNIVTGLYNGFMIAKTAIINGTKLAVQALNMAWKANPLGIVISLVMGLSSVLVVAYNNFESVRAIVQGVWGVLKNLGGMIGSTIKDLVTLNFTFEKQFKMIGKSFNDGYNEEMRKGARERDDIRQAENKKKEAEDAEARKRGEAGLVAHNESLKKKQEVADLETLEKQKEAQEKFLEALKKYQDAKLKITQGLQDLQANQIQDEYEREKKIIELARDRKLQETQKEFAELRKLNVANSAELAKLSQLEADTMSAIRDDADKKTTEKYKAKYKREEDERLQDEEKRQKTISQALKQADDQAAGELEIQNQAFLNKQIQNQEQDFISDENDVIRNEQIYQAEIQKQLSILDIQKNYAQQKLDLLNLANQGESLEAEKLKTQILNIQEQKNRKEIDNEKRTANMKKEVKKLEIDAAQGFLQLGIDILSADEGARKQYADVIKGLTIANIAVGLAREVQGIWENANKNPLNAVIPGWGTGFAVVQTGFAVARAGIAVSKVNAQKFAKGGVLGGNTSHAQGGLSVFDNQTGQQVAEFESKEGFIFSKNAIENNPHLWRPLLYSSLHLGGAPVMPRYADGGAVGNVNVSTPTTNAIVTQGNNDNIALAQSVNSLVQKVDILTNIITENAQMFREVKAIVSIFDIEDAQNDINKVRSQNRSA